MLIELISKDNIDIHYSGKIIGSLKSLTIDLSETPFWIPFPAVKVIFKINNDIADDIIVMSAVKKIKDRLKRFKFIEII